MQAPIFSLVEANTVACIYGCVTIGEDWQFLKLENDTLYLDRQRYYLNELSKLLGILQFIIDSYAH